jgi:hypothetical protein
MVDTGAVTATPTFASSEGAMMTTTHPRWPRLPFGAETVPDDNGPPGGYHQGGGYQAAGDALVRSYGCLGSRFGL